MRFLSYRGIPFWRDARVLRGVAQVISAIIVVSIVVFLINNLLGAADRRGIPLGFGFVGGEAGFPIGESVIGYEESNSYLYAFFVGVLNTLKVAIVGIVLATILGVTIGVARLSSNWLVSRIASVYIEIFRNVPLLLQLFFWYFGVFLTFPSVQESIHWPGPIYLNNRGLFTTSLNPTPSFGPWLLIVLGGIVLAVLLGVLLTRLQQRTGRSTYPLLASALVLILVSALGWFLMDESPLTREVSVLGRFNFEGGFRLTLEFTALLVGLVIYTASFIAEIVRAGILAVQRGQVEASRAVGLSNLQSLRLVIFPQAMRIITPPLINQFLNLTKNSSLAIAVGYPELFQISKTMINQAGRAVPIFLMIMAAYLAMSLTFALIGNIYDRRSRLVER
jgi:general L-amino acid transport system permease protein